MRSAPGDVELTWRGAFVALPLPDAWGQMSAVRPGDKLSKTTKYPVVLYLHGCTGLGRIERELGRALARDGFVFIAPNSMARSYRPLQCDPKSQTGGFNQFVFDFRQAEVSYALERLRTSEWADTSNMYLMGGSEGGVAAALYRGADFNGRIILQWTCRGAPLVRGIAAPADEPVLSIVKAGDPWYDAQHTQGQSGDCGAFMEGRPESRSVILDGAGDHDVLAEPAARRLIREFLLSRLR